MFKAANPRGGPVMVTKDQNLDRPSSNMPSPSLADVVSGSTPKFVMVTRFGGSTFS